MLCSQKNTKADSKHSIAIVNKPLFIPFDLCADLTQIIYYLALLLGHPATTWLRMFEVDIKPPNSGLQNDAH